MNFLAFLEKRSKPFLVTLTILLVLTVGLLDYSAGPQLAFSIFYVLPVSLASWFVSRKFGLGISMISSVTWLLAELLWPTPYSRPSLAYWNASSRLLLFMIVALTLSALRAALEREKEFARTDPLTRVGNTKAFYEMADWHLGLVRRYQRPFTVVYIDLDNFKLVNDRFGHLAGNHLLQLVAGGMKSVLRKTDVVARLGGDEFALLLPETGYEAAEVVLRKLTQALSGAVDGHGWPVTFSIGAVTFTRAPESINQMVGMADQLMYEVKGSGKDRVLHRTVSPEEAGPSGSLLESPTVFHTDRPTSGQ